MPEHVYSKEELIEKFERILNKTLEEIDDVGILNHVQDFNNQKGVVGTIIEQCVLRYPPDSDQRPDLIVVDGSQRIPTELKSTGMRKDTEKKKRFIAKEPMSITAVGVYDIADQSFYESHFWEKIEHMLIVYYHYLAEQAVSPAEYAPFPIKGYEFHSFSDDDIATLKEDWEHVHALISRVVAHHSGAHNRAWKEAVKNEYIDTHGELRKVLSFIDLAPKFPPRFRLKKAVVDSMIAKHFGNKLEQIPGSYRSVSEIDKKCDELTSLYKGMTIGELADRFGVPRKTNKDKENKGIAEQVCVKMFGGKAKKINDIELFKKFSLKAKSITLTPKGSRTEDMKMFNIDFNEITRVSITEEVENGEIIERPITFEDSEIYNYFSENELLCIIFEEPEKEYTRDPHTNQKKEVKHPLVMNKFIGFKRVVISDSFIDTAVRKCWNDTRTKILENKLVDVVQYSKGSPKILKDGSISSAPNFIKARKNDVFIRGSGEKSFLNNKTVVVNGIKMIPQYIWIKGKAIVKELNKE